MNCIMVMALFICAISCWANGRSITEHLEKREIKCPFCPKLLKGVARSRQRRSTSKRKSYIAFDNRSGGDVKLYYKDKTGKNKKKWWFFLVLKKDQFMEVDTFVNDRWKARDIRGKRLDINNKKKIRTELCKPTARDLYIITRKGKISTKNVYVETLVVVDKSVRNLFDSDFKTRTYVETLMDFASKVFLHESLTRYHLRINLLTSQIVILEEEILFKDPSRGDNLNVVCPIMNEIAKKEKRKFDNKLFLTRNDFGAGGFARWKGMCRSVSCSIVRDRGFTSSMTAAHEIAHLFGVDHDEFVQHSKEIMSPIVDATISHHHWSAKSRNDLVRYTTELECLKETTLKNITRETEAKNFTYPGEIFTFEDQCHLEYNSGYTAFIPDEYDQPSNDRCGRLVCNMPGEMSGFTQSPDSPALDGTSCGVNKWCIKGRCERKQEQRQRIL